MHKEGRVNKLVEALLLQRKARINKEVLESIGLAQRQRYWTLHIFGLKRAWQYD